MLLLFVCSGAGGAISEEKGGEVAVALQVTALGIKEGHGGALVGGLDRGKMRRGAGWSDAENKESGGGVGIDGWDSSPRF